MEALVIEWAVAEQVQRGQTESGEERKSTKEIAGLLGISFKTAESHRTRIMKKVDIHEVAGLVRYAVRRGLIQP